jgi:hypothetical protein
MSKIFVRKYYPESYATGETGSGYEIMVGEDPDFAIGEGDSEEMAWADAGLRIIETQSKNI